MGRGRVRDRGGVRCMVGAEFVVGVRVWFFVEVGLGVGGMLEVGIGLGVGVAVD